MLESGSLGHSALQTPALVSFKTVWLIETKLHVEPLWVGGIKVCSWDLGQVIEIFAMPIYGKNPLQISRLKGRRP